MSKRPPEAGNSTRAVHAGERERRERDLQDALTTPIFQTATFRFESAITHAHLAEAPFLIMHGASDPPVDFREGKNFYQALRYNGRSHV